MATAMVATAAIMGTTVPTMAIVMATIRPDRIMAGMAMVVQASALASAAVDTADGDANWPAFCGPVVYAIM
jgi:hypothetical protein